ncbi:MAG: hypothetical protein LQ352_007922 [Teloschistes flavicans]|nr:MAG: hypothetical protein LQ352_007922 [Teloschistes flavicans]
MNPPFLDSNQGVSFDPIISSGLDMPNMEFMDAQQQLPQHELGFFDNLNMDDQMLQSEFDSWGSMGLENDPSMNFNFDKPPTTTPFTFDQPVPPLPLSPLSSGSTSNGGALDEEIPLQTLRILRHYAYFDIAHHTMPIVNQDRFTSELTKSALSPQVTSLSYAMASLGASLMDGYGPTKDRCYQLARKHFEVCEREEDGANLMSIEALQASILITYYELRGKGFARAWMSLGRAIRLAQMMGLDRMDADPGSNDMPKFQQTLPPAQTPLELEERRKAFWVLFIIDAYASVRSGTLVAIDQTKVTTALPSPHPIPEPNQSPMPSLDNAKALYGSNHLSSFTGLVLMVSLYRRCSIHVKLSLDSDSAGSGSVYSFWEHHYSIDKDVKACGDALIGSKDAQGLLEDEVALALSLNLSAIDICLHEAAIVKADKDGLPKALITECNSRCGEAGMRIAEGVSLSQQLVQPKKTVFRQMNIYCMWPVCMAMQVLDRQLSSVAGNSQLAHTVGILKLLVTGIEDLEDVSGHWVDSISHIVKRLEEMESPSIKPTEFKV